MNVPFASASSAPLLSVRKLACRHAGPFSFDLAAGECVAVRGPSGSGKSVLLRMLADLDPHSGDVMLDGVSFRTLPGSAWRSRVVYQAAEPAWWEPTVEAHFRDGQRDFIASALPALGLPAHAMTADIDRLSTGERQRLVLLRSLSCRPQVLLLDEPTSALDPDAMAAVERLLQSRLQQGMALIIVTHAAEQAERLAHRQLHIAPGKGLSA